jgi:pimeloyl-ACP methyl ester carboxylesterase
MAALVPEPVPDPQGAVDALRAAVEESSFDPAPPGRQRPPRRWWGNHLAELRWQLELAQLVVDPVYRGDGVPEGDGAPVLLIPGFLAGDAYLQVMQGWLERLGYHARLSGIVANVDCSDRETDRLERRLARLHERTGRRVAVVGHSRGGHFAKALAHRRPELVCCVVSLGAGLDTPFDISIPTKAAVSAFRALHARTSDRIARNGCFTDCCRCRFAADYGAEFPAEVPLTSIYSRGDGVVWWEACVVPYARCVEIPGSHVGLAFNRHVYAELARTLHREAAAPRGAAAAA